MSAAGNIVSGTLSSVRTIVDTWVPVVLDGDINVDTDAVEAVDIPAVTFDTIDINTAGQYLLAVLNAILALPAYRSIAFEDPGALGMTVETPTLDESLYSSLKGRILTDVQNGGYGIDTLIERDLFERERDAIMDALDTTKATIAATQFSNGLSLPTGEFLGQTIAADLAASRKLEEANQKIIADRFALYADAKKDAYTSGAELAKRLVDEYSIKIKTAIAAYGAKVTAYLKKTEAGVKIASAELSGYLASVEAYSSQMKSLEAVYRSMAQMLEYGYRVHDEALGGAIEEAKAKVEIYLAEAKADLEEEASRLMALAAVATGALSAINVHASVSESSSYSSSNAVNNSASYTRGSDLTSSVTHRLEIEEDSGTLPLLTIAPRPSPPDLARPGE